MSFSCQNITLFPQNLLRPILEKVSSSLAAITMASYDLAAIESNEYANPPHSDTIENTQPRDIPDPGEAITTNDLGAAHGDSSSEESYRQTEADELWKVLKAETGYSSYTDYLKAYIPTHPHLKRLLLRCPLNYKLPKFTQLPKLTILYLSKDKDSRPRVLPRCESASVTSIVTILRQPPANVAVQIVLWNAEAGDYDRSVENALGLGLKINPQFFGALYGPKKRLLDPGYVTIGGFVATVVPYYSPDRQDAIHTVLIARKELESTRTNAVEEEIGGVLPFQYPAVDTNALDTPQNDTGPHTERYDPRTNEHSNYARLLGWYLQKEGKPAVEVGELCLWSLMPLLYLNEMQVHGECQDLRHELGKLQRFALFKWHEPERDQIISDLPQKRFQLRQLVEDSKDDLDHLSKYIRPQTSFFQQVEDEVKKTHEQAFRLEAQIRDFLQLQVGEWALQESKRSIELSNRQMDEGKRGKSSNHDFAHCQLKNRSQDL